MKGQAGSLETSGSQPLILNLGNSLIICLQDLFCSGYLENVNNKHISLYAIVAKKSDPRMSFPPS